MFVSELTAPQVGDGEPIETFVGNMKHHIFPDDAIGEQQAMLHAALHAHSLARVGYLVMSDMDAAARGFCQYLVFQSVEDFVEKKLDRMIRIKSGRPMEAAGVIQKVELDLSQVRQNPDRWN